MQGKVEWHVVFEDGKPFNLIMAQNAEQAIMVVRQNTLGQKLGLLSAKRAMDVDLETFTRVGITGILQILTSFAMAASAGGKH